MAPKPKIIVIVGPTASGKTSLSIEFAKKVGGEVVSADSRQVYRGLDLGTGKVTPDEMQGVPHHLLNVAPLSEIYTASDFVKDARKVIEEIITRGNTPIVCGGSGFYIDVLLGRMAIPEVPPNPVLRELYAGMTTSELYALLQTKDPERAQTIDEHNPVRLIRALEIAEALGKVPTQKIDEPYDALLLGISIPKEDLEARIHDRLIARMKQGMLAEAQELHKAGLSFERMEDLGLEYRYMARHLQGKISEEEMLAQLEAEISKYAKRQMTWFKRHKDVLWVKPEDALEKAEGFLGR